MSFFSRRTPPQPAATPTLSLRHHLETTSHSAVTPADDGLRTNPETKGEYEWSYYDVSAEDQYGDDLSFSFVAQTKRMAKINTGAQPKIEIKLTGKDGKVHSETIRYNPNQLRWSKAGQDITIGDSRIEGDLDRIHLTIEGQKLSADLVFERSVPSYPAGTVFDAQNPDNYLGWVVPMPGAHVTGTITEKGAKPGDADIVHTLSEGSGYHDHNWGKGPNPFDHWYWGRLHGEDAASGSKYAVVDFHGIGKRKFGGEAIDRLFVADESNVLIAADKDITVSTGPNIHEPGPGRDLPSSLDIHGKSQDGTNAVHIHLDDSNATRVEEQDMLADLPHGVREVARVFRNPWYYRLLANEAVVYVSTPAGTSAVKVDKEVHEVIIFGNGKEPTKSR